MLRCVLEKIILRAVMCALVIGFSAGFAATEKNLTSSISIIPKPEKMETGKGTFTLNPDTRLFLQANSVQAKSVLEYFADRLKKHSGYSLNTAASQGKNCIILTGANAPESLGKEGYVLEIKPDCIFIRALEPAGLFYGVQTLMQLLPANPGVVSDKTSMVLPVVKIYDKPRFSWRGMHLDVCRHFFPKDFIKRYIDLIAVHKMNVFHWHLTEDQGWRIEIKKYPKLTEIGAWRVDREDKPWDEREPQKEGEKATYGGFYSQEDVKEIVQYAQSRFITVVPEIEMPAHAVAALTAYPEYSCTGGPFTVLPGGYWPITNIYCAGNDATFEFLDDILTEVAGLFPSPYIHIGGDEANKAEWQKCPKCQARIKTENLKDERELQSYFIKRVEKLLIAKNKKLIGWDEILEGGLAPEATVMSWRGIQGGIDAASQGHDVVMSPTDYCYFDYYQGLSGEPSAIGGYLPLEKVYSYEPIPGELPPAMQKHILGAQGNVWTEYIPNEKHVEYMALPRMCAMAEVVWTPPEQRNLDDFLNRLSVHYLYLDEMDVNYRLPPIGGFDTQNLFIDNAAVTLTKPRDDADIFYTTDGSEPSRSSSLYTQPIPVTENITLIAQAFVGDKKIGLMKKGVFEMATPINAVVIDQVSPGVNYSYFEGSFASVQDLAHATAVRSEIQNSFELPSGHAADNFGVVYSGFIKIPATGVYTFYMTSDDGSELLIGGTSFLLNDGFHGETTVVKQVALQEGFHAVTIHYFEGTGGEMFELDCSGAGMPRGPIPPQMLFH
jgi:hexosaminidase